MNVERLHAIAKAINSSLSTSGSVTKLEQLANSLQQLVSNPNQPQFQQQISSHRAALSQSLDNDPANTFSPLYLRVVDEIGGSSLLGKNLQKRISEIFENNQITPASALNDLRNVLNEVKQFQQVVGQLTSCLSALHIGSNELNPGESGLTVLIPRNFVSNDVLRFSEELKELNSIFGVFNEISTGTRSPFQIRSIGSSGLLVDIDLALKTAAAIAVTLGWLISKYKDLLVIKKLRSELIGTGVPEANVEGVEKYAEDLMDKAIDEWIPKLLQQFPAISDDGRKNEVTIELKFSLKKIAARIDRGFNIEVRVGEKKDKEDADDAEKDTKYLQEIHDATKNMEFIKSEGEPVLKLPLPKDEDGRRRR